MNNIDQYREIFSTDYNFKKEETRAQIEKLKEFDQMLPPSSTFLLIANSMVGKYDLIGKNLEHATGIKREPFIEFGITHYLSLIHKDEIQTWLMILNELMEFCTTKYPTKDLVRMDFQYNYRIRTEGNKYLNILENQVPLMADLQGKPVVALGHFTVFGDGEPLPMRATVRYMNQDNEYETVFHKVYNTKLIGETISNRERDVLRLIALGHDDKEIANKMFLSRHTIRTHRKNMLLKTNSKNSTHLVVQCIKEGLI